MSLVQKIAIATSALSLAILPVPTFAEAKETPPQSDKTVEMPVFPIEAVGCRRTSSGKSYLTDIQITVGIVVREKDLKRVIPRVIENSSDVEAINTLINRVIDDSLRDNYEVPSSSSSAGTLHGFRDVLREKLTERVLPIFAGDDQYTGKGNKKRKLFEVSGTTSVSVQQGCDTTPRERIDPKTIAAKSLPAARLG